MEDVITLLREQHQPSLVALELPDEDRLVEIEEELLIPLPGDYKEFLLSVSDVICGSLEPATVTDPHAHTYLPELAAQAWDQGLPRYLIPLCWSGQDLYAVSQDGQVLLWSAETGVDDDGFGSIWQWARYVWLES